MTNPTQQQAALLAPCIALTCKFEQNSFHPDFAAWEQLGDGRGVTAGFAGFTQYDTDENGHKVFGDLADVWARFLELGGDANAPAYADAIASADVWALLADTSHNLRQAQLDVNFANYGAPALAYVPQLWLRLPIALAIVYDTLVQHGDGDDPDSFGAIRERTVWDVDSYGLLTDEPANLSRFLDERRKVLLSPANKATTDEWRKSVGRVDVLEWLLEHNPQLEGDWQAQVEARF